MKLKAMYVLLYGISWKIKKMLLTIKIPIKDKWKWTLQRSGIVCFVFLRIISGMGHGLGRCNRANRIEKRKEISLQLAYSQIFWWNDSTKDCSLVKKMKNRTKKWMRSDKNERKSGQPYVHLLRDTNWDTKFFLFIN